MVIEEALDKWMAMSSEDAYQEYLRLMDMLVLPSMFATEADWFLQGWSSRRRVMRETLARVDQVTSVYADMRGPEGAW